MEINEDWDDFASFAAAKECTARAEKNQEALRLLTTTPAPLPTYGVAA